MKKRIWWLDKPTELSNSMGGSTALQYGGEAEREV